jgi:hypothetical protein
MPKRRVHAARSCSISASQRSSDCPPLEKVGSKKSSCAPALAACGDIFFDLRVGQLVESATNALVQHPGGRVVQSALGI